MLAELLERAPWLDTGSMAAGQDFWAAALGIVRIDEEHGGGDALGVVGHDAGVPAADIST